MLYTYVIKTKIDINQSMFDGCQEISIDNLRCSVDGLLSVLKWKGEDPVIFSGDIKYTHSQIKVEMAKPEWSTSI